MKTLYLGIDPPANTAYTHYPIIKVAFHRVSASSCEALKQSTHLIFTSKNGVRAIQEHHSTLLQKPVFAVGKQTAGFLKQCGFQHIVYPEIETAEGLVDLIDTHSFSNPYFVWPHSALSRAVISDYLHKKLYSFHAFSAYDTLSQIPYALPDLRQYDEIIFTSPSTVTAFRKHFGQPASHLKLKAIGPVTEQSILLNFLK